MVETANGDVSYRVDREDRIVEVNGAWCEFAAANRGEALLPPTILGRVLWEMIADPGTRHLYQTLVERVRTLGRIAEFPFRCDAPAERRWYRMQLEPGTDGSVSFRTALIRSEARQPIILLDPGAPRSEELIRMCAWCVRVASAKGQWQDLESAVRERAVLEALPVPRVSHGICETCCARAMTGSQPSPS